MSVELWQQCIELLRDELPAQQFNTWIRPLQVEAAPDELRVFAPNRFVLDWVNEKYLGRLLELLGERGNGSVPALSLLIGSKRAAAPKVAAVALPNNEAPVTPASTNAQPTVTVVRGETPGADEAAARGEDPLQAAPKQPVRSEQIGRASCRERV